MGNAERPLNAVLVGFVQTNAKLELGATEKAFPTNRPERLSYLRILYWGLSYGAFQHAAHLHEGQVPGVGYAFVYYLAVHHVQAEAQGLIAAASFLPARLASFTA